MNLTRINAVACMGLVMVLLPGCGCGGPQRFPVSGKVTYDGKPVPHGIIYFTPNAEKGNRGPEGSGPINNGEYRTLNRFGSLGGPCLIRIRATDGVSNPPIWPHGQPLVDYQTEVDLPKSETTLDFTIPKQQLRTLGGMPSR